MAEYLPIRAYERGQKVRINKQIVRRTVTSYVNLEDKTQLREFGQHSAIGAVYPVGPIRTSLPTGTLNGFIATAVAPATEKKVSYTEGVVRNQEGTTFVVVAGTTAAFGAAAANPRIDLIEVKVDGSEVKVKKGTEAASPVAPAVDSEFISIAQVALAKEFTEVKQENVTDVRVLY